MRGLLACEHQLGHRLRQEQYDAVDLFGQTRLAELRTGFNKTDVVLFLVALYNGYGKRGHDITRSIIGYEFKRH